MIGCEFTGDFMCGIAGLAGSLPETAPITMSAMLHSLAHRGPDGSGIFETDDLILGHRRLSILDPSSRGSQPMARGHHVVSFNGEIYNYLELREELSRLGCAFHTGTDTEVLLAAYDTWGSDCVNHFDGMWAFALYDQASQTLFCSRDRFGEKPFLYAESKGLFAFASEIGALQAAGFGRQASRQALLQYLALGRLAETSLSYVTDVKALPPGHHLSFDLRSRRVTVIPHFPQTYRDQVLPAHGSPPSLDELHDLLTTSVKRRLRSDVPMGMLLSGGVDSTTIASIAQPVYALDSGRPLTAITGASFDSRIGETAAAKATADALGMTWHEVAMPERLSTDYLRDSTACLQRPLPSLSMTLQLEVFRAAREMGITVLLDGQGADEVWLGYLRHRLLAQRAFGFKQSYRLARETLSSTEMSLLALTAYAAYFRYPALPALKQQRGLRGLRVPLSHTIAWTRNSMGVGARSVDDVRRNELLNGQLQALLSSADMNSMSASVETRLPYLSWEVVRAVGRVPFDVLFRDGGAKWPLRRMLDGAGLGNRAWDRRKLGFSPGVGSEQLHRLQMDAVIRESELVKALMQEGAQAPRGPRQRWLYYSIALWGQAMDIHSMGDA